MKEIIKMAGQMGLLPTFKTMDMNTPMLQEQMRQKRNQEYIANLVNLIKIQEEGNPYTSLNDDAYHAIRTEIGNTSGKNNLRNYGMGWVKTDYQRGSGILPPKYKKP